jgi:NO-binding membrane sensor protein with MHYT domain
VIGRYRALVELALAGLVLVGAGVSWSHAQHTVAVAPVADGQPFTTSLVYNPQLLLLTLVLLTTAGVLAVVGMARLRRERPLANAHADGVD